MSAIRMMAVFARRVGMTPQAFHDHWRYPHGSLGQGIRIIKRYVQSHQVDVAFLDADQNRYEGIAEVRSEEHTSELQSLMRISYAVLVLQTKKSQRRDTGIDQTQNCMKYHGQNRYTNN